MTIKEQSTDLRQIQIIKTEMIFIRKTSKHVKINRSGETYTSGTAYSLQKRLQVIKSAILTGSIQETAREKI